MEEEKRNVHKIILCGDPGVGKTSLRRRYMGKSFVSNYNMTIGADFAVKKKIFNEIEYLFQIWDLSGQKNFATVRKIYFRNANGLILVCDLSNEESIENIEKWAYEFMLSNNMGLKIPCILLCNKQDLVKEIDNDLMIKCDLILNKIEQILGTDAILFFTSAKTGKNVNDAFDKMTQILRVV